MKVYLTQEAPSAALTLYCDSKQTAFSMNPDGVQSEYIGGTKFTVGFRVCNDQNGRYVVVPEECASAISSIAA
jgi:hypothetical protein